MNDIIFVSFFERVIPKNSNIVELVNFFENIQIFCIHVRPTTLKMTSCRMSKTKIKKSEKSKILWAKKNSFISPCPSALGQLPTWLHTRAPTKAPL
jgi:hypothetical protein